MNENDSIGEIELWMNMTELMKMNYENDRGIDDNEWTIHKDEWQMKWIKKSYGFKISNGYDEDEELS